MRKGGQAPETKAALCYILINADVDTDLASRFGVFTVPTTLIVDAGGQVRHANFGLTNMDKLTAQLRHL